jgi:hypothetical protein
MFSFRFRAGGACCDVAGSLDPDFLLPFRLAKK